MQKHNETLNALRDIVDVLYDGYCTSLEEEELYSTVEKKLKELRRCSPKEKKYKLCKIQNILAAINLGTLPSAIVQEIGFLKEELLK